MNSKRILPPKEKEREETRQKLQKLTIADQRCCGKSVINFLLANGSEVNVRRDLQILFLTPNDENAENGKKYEAMLFKALFAFGTGINSLAQFQNFYFVFEGTPYSGLCQCPTVADCQEKDCDSETTTTTTTTTTLLLTLNGHGVNCKSLIGEPVVPLHKTINFLDSSESHVDPTSALFYNGAQVNSLLFGDGNSENNEIRPLHHDLCL